MHTAGAGGLQQWEEERPGERGEEKQCQHSLEGAEQGGRDLRFGGLVAGCMMEVGRPDEVCAINTDCSELN